MPISTIITYLLFSASAGTVNAVAFGTEIT